MTYTIQNGKFYRSTELTQEEVLGLLNKTSWISSQKLQLEQFNRGKPTSPNVKTPKNNASVPDGTPAAWDNGYGEWLYNHWGAEEECKFLGKRMPTDEEWNLFSKENIPNLGYSGYRGTDSNYYNRTYNTYLWSSTQVDASSAWLRGLNYSVPSVYRTSDAKALGFSLRCVQG